GEPAGQGGVVGAEPSLLGQLGDDRGPREERADGRVDEQAGGLGDQVLPAGRVVVGSRHGDVILDAVDADHVLLVGQLLAVLDQEAGLADELVGLLGLDAAGAVAPVVGLGRLVLVLVVLGGDAVLEDLVEVGLDVVGVELLLVVLLVLVLGDLAGLRGRRGRDVVLLL